MDREEDRGGGQERTERGRVRRRMKGKSCEVKGGVAVVH